MPKKVQVSFGYGETHQESSPGVDMSKSLYFVWRLKKNNFQWTNKKKTEGTMTFANQELLWYIGRREEIDKKFPETEKSRFEFCSTDVIIIILMNRNLNNEMWIAENKAFIQNALNEAKKENVNLSKFNEWWMYKERINTTLTCPECNFENKPDRYGQYKFICGGEIYPRPESRYPINCIARYYTTWDDNGRLNDHYYAIDEEEKEEIERYEAEEAEKETKEFEKTVGLNEDQLKEQSRIREKAMDGEMLTKEEFEKSDEITKTLFKQMVMGRRQIQTQMEISDYELRKERKEKEKGNPSAHDPVTDFKTEIEEDDELYGVCGKYIRAVVDMYGSNAWGAEERRTKWHDELVELSELTREQIGEATSSLDSTIRFPSARLQGGVSEAEKKVIVIDYGHKLYRWILREKRRETK